MHIHLDLVGGLSGDMFISAMLDYFPESKSKLSSLMIDAGFADLVLLDCKLHNDGVLAGTRFHVVADKMAHSHRQYMEIKKILNNSKLDRVTCEAALEIFEIIAIAEAEIHGKEVDMISFHEIGAWDSIADVICAAYLITQSGVSSWSVSSIPIGRGQVRTAHGMLPVPAPATALILKGFSFFDDGVEGERVTPTGAAILKHLNPGRRIPPGLVLQGSATGFGSKVFSGLSNVVRALVFLSTQAIDWDTDEIIQIEFEIDDQTPEALAVALENIRAEQGVLDVLQIGYTGKKGRQGASIRILALPEAVGEITERCFLESTTLGIRKQNLTRSKLPREQLVVNHAGRDFRIKIADRPGGRTAKVEMDDLQAVDTSLREKTKQSLENKVLSAQNKSLKYSNRDE